MDELTLRQEVSVVEAKANEIIVTDEATLKIAAEFARQIKTATAKVTEFFKPIKDNAHKAWKTICDRENEMKKPLETAEKIIKNKMLTYQMEQERIHRQQEEELRRKQREEAERKAREAEELEKQGKVEQAQKVFEEAIKTEENAEKITVKAEVPKVQGISYKTDYIVRIENEQAVPAYISGVCIRPIDTAAIKRLAISSKGQIIIPGISIEETKIASVRGY